jgi:hypothetical protein
MIRIILILAISLHESKETGIWMVLRDVVE